MLGPSPAGECAALNSVAVSYAQHQMYLQVHATAAGHVRLRKRPLVMQTACQALPAAPSLSLACASTAAGHARSQVVADGIQCNCHPPPLPLHSCR